MKWSTLGLFAVALLVETALGLDGGRSVRSGEFSYLAKIEKNNKLLCMGVIVDSNKVLFPAECRRKTELVGDKTAEVVPVFVRKLQKYEGHFVKMESNPYNEYLPELDFAVIEVRTPGMVLAMTEDENTVLPSAAAWSDKLTGVPEVVVVGSNGRVGSVTIVEDAKCFMELGNIGGLRGEWFREWKFILREKLICAETTNKTRMAGDIPPGWTSKDDLGAPLIDDGTVIGILVQAFYRHRLPRLSLFIKVAEFEDLNTIGDLDEQEMNDLVKKNEHRRSSSGNMNRKSRASDDLKYPKSLVERMKLSRHLRKRNSQDNRKRRDVEKTTTEASLASTVVSLAPTEASLAPTVASHAPTEASLAPTEASLAPTVASLAPTEASLAPTVASLAPTEASLTPTKASIPPVDPTHAPANASYAPANASLAPANASLAPAESSTISVETVVITGSTVNYEKSGHVENITEVTKAEDGGATVSNATDDGKATNVTQVTEDGSGFFFGSGDYVETAVEVSGDSEGGSGSGSGENSGDKPSESELEYESKKGPDYSESGSAEPLEGKKKAEDHAINPKGEGEIRGWGEENIADVQGSGTIFYEEETTPAELQQPAPGKQPDPGRQPAPIGHPSHDIPHPQKGGGDGERNNPDGAKDNREPENNYESPQPIDDHHEHMDDSNQPKKPEARQTSTASAKTISSTAILLTFVLPISRISK